MFDFDAGKLLIIGIVALVVIGPKDLPRVLRQVGQMMGRVKRMAGEFQGQFMEAIKEADLQDLRAEVAKLKDTARLDVDFDPAHDVKRELLTAVDGVGGAPLMTGASETDAASVPRGSKSFPSMNLDETPSAAVAIAPVAEIAPAIPSELASAPGDAAASKPVRRKIQVSRRHNLSRLESPRDRAPLPYRSRNILPARRETPDP